MCKEITIFRYFTSSCKIELLYQAFKVFSTVVLFISVCLSHTQLYCSQNSNNKTYNETDPFSIDTCISGIINKYYEVTKISCTKDTIVVSRQVQLAKNDRVLIVQMKGAKLDSELNDNFGKIIDIQNAGNYEFNMVESVNGQTVRLKNRLNLDYDVDHVVQLVYVPVYVDVTLCNITCPKWDGKIGGIITFEASGTVLLEGDIDASGKGFQGGIRSSNFYNFSCVYNDYATFGTIFGAKGEGMSLPFQHLGNGKGRNGNGGGGANPVNSGGGGGGSFSPGGRGGDVWVDCLPISNGYGYGGIGLENYINENRIFLGGGGGGGQQNDNLGTDGAAGGGIIIINAGSIECNQFVIKSNGNDALTRNDFRTYDGQGAGGGGGLIFLNASIQGSKINASANGGNGANVIENRTNFEHGPGGGGGGGSLIVKRIDHSFIQFSARGGKAGTNTYVNKNWGAEDGMDGGIINGLSIYYSEPTPTFNINLQLDSFSNCVDEFIIFRVTDINNHNDLIFNLSGNGIDTTSNSIFQYIKPGVYNLYVVESTGCIIKDTSLVFLTKDSVYLPKITEVCANESATLSAPSGKSYLWSTGETTRNITVVPNWNEQYAVTVTDDRGCAFTALTSFKVVRQILRSWASSHAISEGNSITIHALPRNVTNCQWYKDFVPIPFANDSIFIAHEEGFYEVEGDLCGRRTKSGLWKIFVNKKKAGENFNGLEGNSPNTNSPDDLQIQTDKAFSRGLICEVYPNPVFDIVQLKINEFGAFKIYDTKGVVWHSFNILIKDKELITINMSNWPSGVYFIESNSNDSRYVEKIIKL
jgi:hypothetical protein